MPSHKNYLIKKGKFLLSVAVIFATIFVSNNAVINASAKNLSVLSKFTYGVAINDNQIPSSTKLVEGPWVMGDLNEGNTKWLSEFNKPENLDKTPLIYMYVVAGMARSDWGLQDCNVGASPDKTLCKNGANYLRQNSSKIEYKYYSIINQLKEIMGQNREIAIHIEPDFYQYSEEAQYDGGITADQGAREMNKWTSSLKSNLPNASLILDVAPWNKDLREWSSKFQNFDYAGLVGKRYSPNGNGNTDGKTFKQIVEETGKKLIINDSHGPGGWWLEFNYDWAIKEQVRDRTNDGVLAVILPPNNLYFLDQLQKLNNQYTPPPLFTFPQLIQSSSSIVLASSSSSSTSSSVAIASSSLSSSSSSSSTSTSQNQTAQSSTSTNTSSHSNSPKLTNFNRTICMSGSSLVTLTRSQVWDNGYTGTIKIKNLSKSSVIDWSTVIILPADYKIKETWNLNSNVNNTFTPKSNWNKFIEPNQEVEVGGFNGTFEKDSGTPIIKCNVAKARSLSLPVAKL
jgi:hypothetical protein